MSFDLFTVLYVFDSLTFVLVHLCALSLKLWLLTINHKYVADKKNNHKYVFNFGFFLIYIFTVYMCVVLIIYLALIIFNVVFANCYRQHRFFVSRVSMLLNGGNTDFLPTVIGNLWREACYGGTTGRNGMSIW